MTEQQPKVYVDISAEQDVTEIESLCMACRRQGTTRLLLTRVPHFKEIILMAFSCPHCGYQSNEIQSGAAVQKFGIRYSLRVTPKDMNRQVVKGDTATIALPHIDFEMPPSAQRGTLNTIEGFLSQAATGLGELQPQRRLDSPEIAAKIDEIIAELNKCAAGEVPEFVLVIDDPSGNSFVENPLAPSDDPMMSVLHYKRSREQNHELAMYDEEEVAEAQAEAAARDRADEDEAKANEEDQDYLRLVPKHKDAGTTTKGLPETHDRATVTQEQEVFCLTEECPMCSAKGDLRSVLTKIPHFKDVVIMAFSCDHCGYKTNTVQPGGAVPDHGTRTELMVEDRLDLTRSFLKSESASLLIPALELELGPGTLGSRFTSVEGILDITAEELKKNSFICGDSAADTERMNSLLSKLERMKTGEEKFTLVVDDPMSNSYIQNPNAPEADPRLKITQYVRTWQQNEDLGLNDMHTELDPVTGQYVAAKPPTMQHPQ